MTTYFMLCERERGGCGHEIPLPADADKRQKIDVACPICRKIWQRWNGGEGKQ